MAGQRQAWDYLEGLKTQMNRVRHISARKLAFDKLIAQHAAVVEGIRTRNAAKAEAAMRDHLREINRDLPEIVAAMPDFFEEAGEKAKVHPGEPFITFKHDTLQLWCGDFFQLVPEDLKHVRLVYDRAALIALPPELVPFLFICIFILFLCSGLPTPPPTSSRCL